MKRMTQPSTNSPIKIHINSSDFNHQVPNKNMQASDDKVDILNRGFVI